MIKFIGIFLLTWLFATTAQCKNSASCPAFTADHTALPKGRTVTITPNACHPDFSKPFVIDYYSEDSLIGRQTTTKPIEFVAEKVWTYTILFVVRHPGTGKSEMADSHYIGFQSFEIRPVVKSAFGTSVFIGIPCPLQVAIPGIPSESISISVVGGTSRLGYTGVGNYVCETSGAGKTDLVLAIGFKWDGLMVSAGQIHFPVRAVPAPNLLLSKNLEYLVESDTSIRVLTNFSDMELPFISGLVDSFEMVYELNRKKIAKRISGNLIHGALLKELKALPPGTWVYFNTVYYQTQTPAGSKLRTGCFANRR